MDVISRGQDMNTVKEILKRWNVIEDMKAGLTEQEDALTRRLDVDREVLADKQFRISVTRNNLNDLMELIEDYIKDGVDEVHYQEQQQEEATRTSRSPHK